MKFHSFQVSETREIYGRSVTLHVGSEHSREDAMRRIERAFGEIESFYAALPPPGGSSLRDSRSPSPEETQALRWRIAEIIGHVTDDGEYMRPICEEILHRIDASNVVTRNHYGAEVLNSENVCFLDIDPVPSFLGQLVSSHFRLAWEERRLLALLERIVKAEGNEDLGFRVYRTSAGFRIIADAPDLTLDSPRFESLVKRLGVDPLYVRLCHLQRCFRARLTPKPYRINLPFPSSARFPVEDENVRREIAAWLDDYSIRSTRYAVCRLVDTVGKSFGGPIVEFHDETTGAMSDRPLK